MRRLIASVISPGRVLSISLSTWVEVPKENIRSGMETPSMRARLRRFSILVTWMTVWRRT